MGGIAYPNSAQRAGPEHRRRGWRYAGLAFAGLVGLLVIARLALPSYLRDYVNAVLDQSRSYDGRIGDVDVYLWRGAYTVRDIKIVKTRGEVPVPLFEGREVDIALDWSSLLHGRLRGRVWFDHPRVNFVHGPTDADTQTGKEMPWLQVLDDLTPFRIESAEVVDGEVHFEAFRALRPVDVYLSDVRATLSNLTNVQDKVDPLVARVEAAGTAMNSGRFTFRMTLDPASYRPTFALACQLLGLDVTELDALTKAYGDFDFEGGQFDLAVELNVKEGRVEGYAKPLFRNVQVISHEDLKEDNPLQVLWESIIGAVGEAFQNQPRDQFGTRITITGNLEDPRTSLLEIVGNVLYNAFVRAYLPRIEGRVAPAVAGVEK